MAETRQLSYLPPGTAFDPEMNGYRACVVGPGKEGGVLVRIIRNRGAERTATETVEEWSGRIKVRVISMAWTMPNAGEVAS